MYSNVLTCNLVMVTKLVTNHLARFHRTKPVTTSKCNLVTVNSNQIWNLM